ncbi:hypothetical protein BH11PSE11_BH11PSE11_35670 [soil metagenome]
MGTFQASRTKTIPVAEARPWDQKSPVCRSIFQNSIHEVAALRPKEQPCYP